MRAQLLCRTDLRGLHWYLSGGWNKFCAAQSFEISIDFSMPLHRGFAQSNGLVERTVQTAKKLLKKTYEDNKNPYSGVYFTKYFNSWRWSFFHSVCSWGVAQKHHSYKEYLAKANGLRPQWSSESAEKKKKTASSEELFWWKVQVPWTTKTWRYQSATGRNLGTSRAVGEI